MCIFNPIPFKHREILKTCDVSKSNVVALMRYGIDGQTVRRLVLQGLYIIFCSVLPNTGRIFVMSSWKLIVIASASQAEGDGFDPRVLSPKLALDCYCFVPKNCQSNASGVKKIHTEKIVGFCSLHVTPRFPPGCSPTSLSQYSCLYVQRQASLRPLPPPTIYTPLQSSLPTLNP